MQAELRRQANPFTPDHKTIREIQAEFRAQKLPCGDGYVRDFVRSMIRAGRAKQDRAWVIGARGRKVRLVKYLFLS